MCSPVAPCSHQPIRSHHRQCPEPAPRARICLGILQLPPTPLACLDHHQWSLWALLSLLQSQGDPLVGLSGEKHHSPARQGSQRWGNTSQGTAVVGRSCPLDCYARTFPLVSKYFLLMGVLEKSPPSTGSGSLTHAVGTRWHPASGTFVQSREKRSPWKCFYTAYFFSKPVGLQGCLRVGRVGPADIPPCARGKG